MSRRRCLALCWSLLAAASLAAAFPTTASEVDFLRDVRPILSSRCFKCHGPDAKTRKSGLRLDLREAALAPAKSGEVAIHPGRPDVSELVRRILAEDEDDLMPPPEAKTPLTSQEKDILRRWIEGGAEYTPHWAFVKPQQHAPPVVTRTDWPRNPIDQFILAKMETAGLTPSAPADEYTLVRRVYLDLIGLPPTPEQADAFVSDPSPDAFERLVDTLLSSPRYGERWARRWLDLARYADTNGYEKDRPRSIWPYRDWVINAINAGKPFDDFTVEQIAGDILAEDLPTDDSRRLDLMIATGFHRNAMINEEGGADPQEYRFYAMVDRVHVTATTWLGLTMSCAQCHTHKYDPIQHDEYYQFMALMNNADEPWIDVPTPDITARRREQQQTIAALEADLINQFPAELKADWITPGTATFTSEAGTAAARQADGSFLLEGEAADKDTYTIALETSLSHITHLQVLALPDDSLAKAGPGRAESGSFVLSEIDVTAAPANDPTRTVPVRLVKASADAAQSDFPAWHAIDGKTDTGWVVATDGDRHVPRTLTLDFAEPTGFAEGTRFVVRLKQQHGKRHLLGRFRLSLGRALPDGRPLEQRRLEHLDRRMATWLSAELPKTVEWQQATPVAATGSYPTLNIEADNTVFVTGDVTKSDTYTVTFNGDWTGVRALRIEALPDERLPDNGPGRVNYEGPFGDFFLSDVKVFTGEHAVRITSASDSFHGGSNDAAKALDDDLQSGWSINGGQGRSHNAVFVFDQPLDGSGALTLQMIFERYYASGLGKFRVWTTREEHAVALPHPNDVQDTLLAVKRNPARAESPHIKQRLREYYVTVAPELGQERAELLRLRRALPTYPTTLVMVERAPGHTRPTRLHTRGAFLQPAHEVQPGLPSFLPPLPADAPKNRLGFARWLVSSENPLTPRVVMNREWQALFGQGLVQTLEDFGFQGDLPSHPELLDWLAVEFVNRQWSLKQMHKLMVMSATYQQSSHVTPEKLEKDPKNVLLSRGPRFRLDAEIVRDAALSASGLIAHRVGGPSVYPPQPASITTEGAFGPLTWTTSTGPDRYRRSLYTFAKRTAPFAMFNIFDGPSGEACMVERDRSNTPLQSLTLLNDDAFLEMARALGAGAATDHGTIEERTIRLFRRVLTRPPTAGEVATLVAFYEKQADRFASGDLDAAALLGTSGDAHVNERAAWTAVARVLMNLDETVTRS